MAKKRLMSKLCALIVIALLASGGAAVYAEKNDTTGKTGSTAAVEKIEASENISRADAISEAVALYERLRNTEVEVSRQLSDAGREKNAGEDFLKAVVLGYANLDDIDEVSEAESVTKQDMMNILYKTVINYDHSFAIVGDEADDILNSCYDNAYINEENRVAYAFMMKQGIISGKSGTDPDKLLTRESCDTLTEEIYGLFAKEITFDLKDISVTVGANIASVTDELGQPDRVDDSVYGFKWYVYNSKPESYMMIGVQADRVCAVYSNSADFGTGSIGVGDAYVRAADYKGDSSFTFYVDNRGRVDAILYNRYDKEAESSNKSVKDAALQVADMVNAYRVKNGLSEYSLNPDMTDDALARVKRFAEEGEAAEDVTYASGFDPFCVYYELLRSDNEILTKESNETDSVGVGMYMDDDTNFSFALTEGLNIKSTPSYVMPKPSAEAQKEYKLSEVAEITTPVIAAPTAETVYEEGDDVVVELAMQAATQYHVEVFDVESDDYAVNEYIRTDSKEITLPAELFKRGADYRLVVSAITDEGTALSSADVLFSYGDASEDGVVILTPFNEGSTDDDYIGVSWESEQYHDFLVDLYDAEGKLIASEVIKDEYEAVIRGVDPGDYYVYVTALSRDTSIVKSSASAKVTINMPEPVITETVLEPDEVYYLTYDDPEMGVMYFYDEEIIEVEEKAKNGRTVKTKKKKIIQKEVKATKAYQKLGKNRRILEKITGEPKLDFLSAAPASEIGQKIVNEASKYLGVPYVWGGTTPAGFDCSGLVQYVLRDLGIDISRVTQTQVNEGVPVAKSDLQPGDLIFFESNGDVHHVGIYIGYGQMIHAPHTGDVVKITDLDTPYYEAEYYCARRIY